MGIERVFNELQTFCTKHHALSLFEIYFAHNVKIETEHPTSATKTKFTVVWIHVVQSNSS